MPNIRACSTKDYDDIIALSEYAFNYHLNDEERVQRAKRMDTHKIFGIFDDDRLAAKLHILPMNLYLGGKSIPFGGIASVATWAEYRRQGFVKELLLQSLMEMKARGIGLSLLHPFSINFYRKYGWELTQYSRKISFSPNDLPKVKGKGIVRRVTFQREKQIIQDLYQTQAKQYGLMLVRDEFWWEDRVLSPYDYILVYYNECNTPEGFMVANINNESMKVEEIFYQTHNAWKGLIEWIRNHDSMVDDVEMYVLPNDGMSFYFDNPKVEEKQSAYFMSRIVDITTFFQNYPFPALASPITIEIEVEDSLAEWNNNTWLLHVDKKGRASVEKGKSDDVNLVIRGDIQALTALWLNSQSVKQLEWFQQIKIQGDKDVLKSLIVSQTPAFLDFF